jgi:hypothetical protein
MSLKRYSSIVVGAGHKEGRHIFKAVVMHALMNDNPSPRRGGLLFLRAFS